jgi:outer membrane protein OmpA-like peptidoglycan-associated protein
MDIYACDLDEWGKVSNVRNIGDQINSDADEIFVHLASDGKTLYFCSNGHNTIGGYDIFVSTCINDAWTKARNIGYPLNTASDEISFSARADGTVAYIASNREGSYGDYDIFKVSFGADNNHYLLNTNDLLFTHNKENSRNIIREPSTSIPKTKVWLFKGTVSDINTGEAIEAEIEIVDNRSRSVISHFHSNADDGSFLVILAPGNNYALTMESDRYLFHSENFIISPNADYKEIYKNIRMKPFSSGEKIVLANIFFKGNTASLEQESFFELERVATLMNDDHPHMRVEIGAHTDNQNPGDFSHLLSVKRARAVANYMIDYLKVPEERIEIKGYGDQYPLASNESEEGRRQNNRIELKIIDME